MECVRGGGLVMMVANEDVPALANSAHSRRRCHLRSRHTAESGKKVAEQHAHLRSIASPFISLSACLMPLHKQPLYKSITVPVVER